MAWFEADIFKKCITVDLHGYSHRTAVIMAKEKIKEGFDHGFKNIRLIHGASGIREKNDGGSIKFSLRSMLKSGELDKWVEGKDSKDHKIRNESLILALRHNPKPQDKEWIEMPIDEY